MTKNRKLKGRIRERMAKTGERYAAARAQVLRQGTDGSLPPDGVGIFPGYPRCGGVQTETSTLRNALFYRGVEHSGTPYSEALVFGLCGGIGFLYAVFEYQGFPPMLTIVGRARSMPDSFLVEGLSRIGVETTVVETTSPKRAQAALCAAIEAKKPALCTVDVAALPYYGLPKELLGMGPHTVGVVGQDGDRLWLDDRSAAPVAVDEEAFAAARAGYRRAKHRLVTLGEPTPDFDLGSAIRAALRFAVDAYDAPPAKSFAKNVGTAGLEKWSALLAEGKDKKAWARVFDAGPRAYVGLRRIYDCIQHDYTAPNAGRAMYADFIDEAAPIAGIEFGNIAKAFRELDRRWAELSAIVTDADPAVRAGCELSDRRAELLDGGGDVADEMKALYDERRSLADKCALDPERAADVYRRLSTVVEAIAKEERNALDQLRTAL
ncbi:MAG: BtrH N-terminal domain-containing protein [Myxococcota bacterium]